MYTVKKERYVQGKKQPSRLDSDMKKAERKETMPVRGLILKKNISKLSVKGV